MVEGQDRIKRVFLDIINWYMNIAFVHDVFPMGGAERVTIAIARYLSHHEQGFRIFVYCKQINESLVGDAVRDILTVRLVPKGHLASSCIERLVVEDGIQVLVQVVHRIPGIERIKQNTGVKVVMSNHGEPFWQRYLFMKRKQRRHPILWKAGLSFIYGKCGYAMRKAVKITMLNLCSCDAYTVLCEDYKSTICGKLGLNPDSSHIVVIGNAEHPVDDVCMSKDKVIMYCGRLYNSTKRVDRLLRIWGRVQNRLPDWRLILVGDGPDREDLENQILKDRLERVTITGWVSDVSQYYRQASILCLTSQTESWGLSLTEAQANGVIPVVFDCSAGVRSIIEPSGVNGFLVPSFDEEEYASTLLRVAKMSDDEQYVLRTNVVKKCSEYSLERVGKKWRELFDSLC